MPEQQQTLTIQQALDLAVQHHTAGRLPQAESIYNQILQSDPDQPVALHLLGVIAHQVGKNDSNQLFLKRLLRKAVANELENKANSESQQGRNNRKNNLDNPIVNPVRQPCSRNVTAAQL